MCYHPFAPSLALGASRNSGVCMFGEVRSILQRQPSESNWEELCQLVSEDWRRPGFEEDLLPYILSHLDEWPDSMRTTPLRWRDGLVRGASLPFVEMVRVLDTTGMELKNEDMWTLAKSPVMRHITGLILRGNKIGWRGMNHLFEGEEAPAPHLRSLDLSDTAIGGEGVRLLARTDALPKLESLSLEGLHLSGDAIDVLMSSETLVSLVALDLGRNNLTARHLDVMTQGALFERIRVLCLDHNALGAQGGLRLARRASINHLTGLSLVRCNLPSPIVEALGRTPKPLSCQVLRLSHNAGLSALGRLIHSEALPSLRVLEVDGERAHKDDLLAAAGSEHLENLEFLAVSPRMLDEELSRRAAARGRLAMPAPVPVYNGLCREWC